MSTLHFRTTVGALAAAAAALWLTPAYPHAVCGDRIFPATLAIDDPGVGDELALPTVTWIPQNSTGSQQLSTTFTYSKTIFPFFALSVADGPSWQNPGGYGWFPLVTEGKWNFFCFPEHEFMGSVGFVVTWNGTGTGTQVTSTNTYSPVLNVGKGFGDLPTSLNILRPFAVTAAVTSITPGQAVTNGVQNATTFGFGFTLQYSLPCYNEQVGEIGNGFFKHLIPIVEGVFTTPIANAASGTPGRIGTIQPGAIYEADTWQFALEAVIPVNGASGHGVGVVGELHFFFDDIFPNTIGRPIFTDSALFPRFGGGK
jgi:hypothetical protein